jgi:hypothetical protein
MSSNKYLKKIPLENCAARYLQQWQTREQLLYEGMSCVPHDEDIKKSLAYFKVSRNFTGLKSNPKAIGSIRKALLSVRRSQQYLSPHERVTELSNRFSTEFESFNLSAASKLLWLSERSPYIVYDRRAVRALTEKLGQRLADSRDYEEYANVWRTEYNNVKTKIAAAIRRLPSGRAFMPATSLTDSALRRFADEDWFKERVFDIFLWEIGGDSHDH